MGNRTKFILGRNNFMENQYASDMLKYLYEEGDRDLIFFGQILGVVSYDENDNLFRKTPERRLSDAIKLVNYLISLGDFDIGRTLKQKDGEYINVLYKNGLSEFLINANELFSKNGIDDIDLNSGIWLKKLHIGQSISRIPNEITELFR